MTAALAPTSVPTWIEASAGTGKTYTLERIVLSRIEEGAAIDSILVVTFTEKATRQMRLRVRQAIDARAAELKRMADDDARVREARLRAARRDFDRATIATIHGFCRRLLREHAFVGRRALDEAHESGDAFEGALVRSWLSERLDAGGTLGAVLSASIAVMNVERLTALLLDLLRERSAMLPLFELDSLERALAAIPTGDALGTALVELVELAGPHPTSRARLSATLQALDAARAEPSPAVRLRALFAWAAPDGDAHGGASWLSARLADHPRLGEPLRTLARHLATPLPALAAWAVPDLRRASIEGKARAGIVDFDELVLGVRRALEGDDGQALVTLIRARYRHVVVDEFQDTDPDQWEILRRLFLDCDGGRSFVLIGDPKQAIYGFRGADVHTYLRAEREVSKAGATVRLGTSYRPTPDLLRGLHRILLPGEGEPTFFSRPNTYAEHVIAGEHDRVAMLEDGRNLAPITLLSVRGDPPLRLRPARRALARAIAAEARTLLDERVMVGRPGALRRLTAADVFVLTRSVAEGLEVAEALTRASVPHAFFKQDGLFRTAEAKDFSDLLAALALPEDRQRVARALATPFFGVAPEDYGALGTLSEEHPLMRRFQALAHVAESRPIIELLSSIMELTGITRRELYLYASERRLTNYLHLAEALATLAQTHHAGLRELSSRLVMLTEGRSEIGEGEDVQRLPSERSAVQILTMHKAKGLEAEAVFVYGGLGRPRGSSFERRTATSQDGERIAWLLPRMEGTSDPRIEASIAAEEREEAERLAYVAMTRARSLLYLPYYEADATPSRIRGPYRVVHDRLSALVRTHALDAPTFRVEAVSIAGGGKSASRRREPLSAPAAMPAARALPEDAAFETLGRSRGGGIVTSYSRMKRERDRRAGTPEVDATARYDEATVEEPVGMPDDPGGAGFGVAVHRVLELVPLELVRRARDVEAFLADPDLVALGVSSLLANGLDERALPSLGALAFAGLTTGIPMLGGRSLAEPTRRSAEMPFVHVLPEAVHPPPFQPVGPGVPPFAIERGYLRGVIDLLFEHDEKLYVVDWKTDRLPAYDARSIAAHVEAHYTIQMRLYALALRRMLAHERGRAADARLGGVLFVFLRGRTGAARADGALFEHAAGLFDGLHFTAPSMADLDAWDRTMRTSDAPFGYPLGRVPSAWGASAGVRRTSGGLDR